MTLIIICNPCDFFLYTDNYSKSAEWISTLKGTFILRRPESKTKIVREKRQSDVESCDVALCPILIRMTVVPQSLTKEK